MRLKDALAALDARSFERLCRRHGVEIDPKRRLSPAEQAARQLADLPRRVVLAELPEPAQKVLWLLAGAGEGAARADLGGGVLPLLSRDLVFPVPSHPERVAMPSAFRVQLPLAPGEDRERARALLSTIDPETYGDLSMQLLGRRPVGPPALWLGVLLETLESSSGIDELVRGLSPKQKRLLEAIEARGGQLETDELLELEQSPIRLALAGGTALPTRSASYALFVRGLLLPRARGLWTIPAEVAEHVGAARRAALRDERRRLLSRVALDEELSPARATLGDDPGPIAVALIAALRARDALPADVQAVRRSDLIAAANEVGVSRDHAELLVALARAAGARFLQSTLDEVFSVLFLAWARGSIWDEARTEPDAYRAGEQTISVATPTRALRDVVVELLEPMAPDRFAPVDDLVAAVLSDLRVSGAARMLERGSRRASLESDPEVIARRIVLASLPALGAVDYGVVDGAAVVRLSARARRLRSGQTRALEASQWEGGGRLRVEGSARVRDIVSAAEAATAFATDGALVLRVDEKRVAAALGRGLDAAEIRARLETIAAPIDPAVERAIAAGIEALRPRLRWQRVSAFVQIEDEVLRARVEDAVREMLVVPSPSSGILVRADVDPRAFTRALDALGIVIEIDDESTLVEPNSKDRK